VIKVKAGNDKVGGAAAQKTAGIYKVIKRAVVAQNNGGPSGGSIAFAGERHAHSGQGKIRLHSEAQKGIQNTIAFPYLDW